MHIINNIFIRSGVMQLGIVSAVLSQHKFILVTDTQIPETYWSNMNPAILARIAGIITLPAGEAHKTFHGIETILNACVAHKLDRSSAIIACGGGIVSDLAGFAAAIYMRGIDWISIPTTLIAQVDAAYGGKTGCNFLGHKNLIGAFHNPSAIFVDPQYLQTLSPREYNAGLAETIKYGVAFDANFFEWLENNKLAIKRRNLQTLERLVIHCCELKMNIVAQDPKDKNRRMLLNFGHTFGHAIESATNFTQYLHGEAVAIGMSLAARLAVKMGMLEQSILKRLHNLLEYFELPINCLLTPRLFDYMESDKKNNGSKLNLILPYKLGMVKIVSLIDKNILEGLIQDHVE